MTQILDFNEARLRKLKLLLANTEAIKQRLERLQHSERAMARLMRDLGFTEEEIQDALYHNREARGRHESDT